jgi:hypothetical protein
MSGAAGCGRDRGTADTHGCAAPSRERVPLRRPARAHADVVSNPSEQTHVLCARPTIWDALPVFDVTDGVRGRLSER